MNKVPEPVRKELAALAAKTQVAVDFSDSPATLRKDWQGAKRDKLYRAIKQQLTVRVDADVLSCLKSEGGGYQSHLYGTLRIPMLRAAGLGGDIPGSA